MQQVRVGVVGCGNVALCYVPSLKQSPYVELVALCDARLERAQEMAERFEVGTYYDSFEQMLAEAKLDLVVNLTSMNFHGPYNKAALEAGIHVWCEKPISTDLEEAKELLEIARRHNVGLYCAPNAPASPAFQFMAEAIHSGKLGKVTAANGIYGWSGPLWGKWFYEKGGGVLFDLGVYNITTLTGLLGPAKSVMAMTGVAVPERTLDSGEVIQVEAEDNVAILIDHGNSVFSTLQSGFVYHSQNEDWTIQVIGTGGAMTMLGFDWEPRGVKINSHDTDGWQLQAEDQQTYGWADGASYIAECLVTGKKPVFQGEHAVHVLEVMHAALKSSETGRKVNIESTFAYPLYS